MILEVSQNETYHPGFSIYSHDTARMDCYDPLKAHEKIKNSQLNHPDGVHIRI